MITAKQARKISEGNPLIYRLEKITVDIITEAKKGKRCMMFTGYERGIIESDLQELKKAGYTICYTADDGIIEISW